MGSIVVPIAVATSFGLDNVEIMNFVARALFVLGIAGILQVTIGHRLPIQEGPAGVWWGVFTLYSTIGIELYGSQKETLRALSFCFLVSGVLFIVLALLGLIDKIAKLFTPTVMGAYLVLMVVQLSGTFLKGMAGVNGSSPINPLMFLLSIITIILAYVFAKIKALGAYSTLCSILVGWALFAIFGQAQPIQHTDQFFKLPEIFVFGMPKFDSSMVLSGIFLTFLLTTNLLASISAVQIVFKNFNQPYDEKSMKKASIASGIIHILAGTFSAIGSVPISGSAAFISQTKNTDKKPFIIGNFLIILISLSPFFTAVFAALPVAVGYAALVPTFGIGTIGIAINQLDTAKDKAARNLVVGASWFVGMGLMFFPSTAYAGLNPLLRTIVSNGLIIGAIVAVVLDQMLTRRKAAA
jgi:xanthine/uracil permease